MNMLISAAIPLLLILFLIRSIRNLLYQLFFWQKKEYRWDTMWLHLKSSSGQRWVFGKISLIKWVLLSGYATFYVAKIKPPSNFPGIELVPLILFFALEVVLLFREWVSTIKAPKFTPKTLVIIAAVILCGLILYLKTALPLPLKLLLLDKLLAILVTGLILITGIPALIWRKIIIWQATNKIKTYPKLIRIGITGSFGKSSTKEYLAALLTKNYTVAKTERTDNTDIGISKTILKQVNDKTQVLIVEMGAYKKGEIKTACQIVRPTIGIVTGINEQHIELFGSISNTRQAKYELIEALPVTGLAVFNGENEYTRLMARKTKNKQVIEYGFNKKSDVWANQIKQKEDGVDFILHLRAQQIDCKTNLLGKHQVLNLLAAAAVGDYLKISNSEIKSTIGKLPYLESRLKKVGRFHGATLIDDTFNVNPQSIMAAVDYLQLYTGNKYLVLTPMIELGKYAAQLHETAAAYGSKHQVNFLVTNNSFYKEIVAGAKKYNGSVILTNQKQLIKKLQKSLQTGDAVVFCGKEARHILRRFKI